MNTVLPPLILCMFLPVTAALAAEAVPQQKEQPSSTPTMPVGQAPVLGQPLTPNLQTPAAQTPAQAPQTAAGEQQASPRAAQSGDKEPDAQALFQESLRQMMPLSEEQIQEYRRWSDQRDRALLPVSPTLSSRSVHVELEPGRAPVVVRTTANIATSLVFHDSTGQPWPITSVTNGGPTFFQVLRPDLPEGNLLNVMPIQAYGAANLVITFSKKDVPLVIRLEADSVRSPERRADSLVLFQIGQHGPNAQAPLTKEFKESASSVMLAFLDHVPPSEAVRIPMEPKDKGMTLWKYRNIHYLRTSHSLMWPSWTAVVNGAGGLKCYELPKTPRILISREGVIETFVVRDEQQ